MEIVDMITRTIDKFLNARVGVLQEKNLILTLPNGYRVELGNHRDSLEITFNSWLGIWLIFRRGSLGFTEGYVNNYWQTKDILDLMEYLPQNLNALSQISDGIFSYKISSRINHYFNKNTLSGSKKNIKAHYDLGNDFYSLWLDGSMTYSSGIFYSETSTLQEAQENKYQSILNLLNLKKGSKILEIGCGWGGFLEYASSQGFDVKGITISPSQFNYVKAKQKNSKSKSDIQLIDYRFVSGRFDAIVSIEMFEAVGSEYWDMFFSKIRSLLKENGKAAIQTITIGDTFFDNYKNNPDFIQTYIFPGGMLASNKIIHQLSGSKNLEITQQNDFGSSYAKTLEIWFENFQKAWRVVETMGFDERFKNKWDMYLAYCRGGFLSERISVSQYLLEAK